MSKRKRKGAKLFLNKLARIEDKVTYYRIFMSVENEDDLMHIDDENIPDRVYRVLWMFYLDYTKSKMRMYEEILFLEIELIKAGRIDP